MNVPRSSARAHERWPRRFGLASALLGAACATQDGGAETKLRSVVSTLQAEPDVANADCSARVGSAFAPPGPIPEGPAPASDHTIVSLAFDDTHDDQYAARPLLAQHGFHATFFVNSSRLGLAGYLTMAELQQLQADGHEIAGHTVEHADLPTVDADEQRREICDDRVTLLAAGFPVTSFAYPFGDTDASIEQIVAGCGYNSGRGVGGVVSPGTCDGCPFAESVPPGDVYHTRTLDSIQSDTTLADMEGYVEQAELHGGGWVQIVMHHVCDGCATTSVSASTLSEFLDWLEPRSAFGTTVKRFSDVIGGPVRPGVMGPLPTTSSALQNPSLEAVGADGTPTCWQRGGYGTNTAQWTLTDDARSGSYAQRVDMLDLTYGDQKLISRLDLGSCAPLVSPGATYRVTAWYETNAPVRFIAYYRTASGAWVWWAEGPVLRESAAWSQGAWTTPPVPAGSNGIGVGLSIRGVGFLTMDDFTFSAAP